jgi:hypothetical protein
MSNFLISRIFCRERGIITINVPVVFMARYVMILRGATSLRLFWAQMALASLVPFQGPKKSRFSGPTPSNAPSNDVAPLKIITYQAIKTTGTLVVLCTRVLLCSVVVCCGVGHWKGWALKIETFLGPEMARTKRVMMLHPSKSLRTAP